MERFGEEGNDDLSQIEYVDDYTKIKIIDPKYGPYLIRAWDYYKGNRSMKCKAEKIGNDKRRGQDEVFDKIRKLHPDLEILPDQIYKGLRKYILVKDKYGICRITPGILIFQGTKPSIKSAIDKTSYWINQAREVHGDKYDYSLVDYINNRTKVKIISQHGVFEQTPNSHLNGCGCPTEANKNTTKRNIENPTGWRYEAWIKSGEKSKNFDSFKVYFIECTCEETGEHFYKIGKTFLKVFGKGKESRFPENPIKAFPYKGKLIHTIESEDARKICELEDYYKKLNRDSQYIPTKSFGGMYECFSQIDKICKKK